jgi:hypothetical protein
MAAKTGKLTSWSGLKGGDLLLSSQNLEDPGFPFVFSFTDELNFMKSIYINIRLLFI